MKKEIKKYKYDGSKDFDISSFDCSDKGSFSDRTEAEAELAENLEQISALQKKLYAEKKEGVIFIFQALDAAGKDGTIDAVFGCLSTHGVNEYSFKTPTATETRHDYLWRFWPALPEKGGISIFNRSYYEDVLCQRVHRYYESYSFADRIDTDDIIDERYPQIRNFEKYLWENSIRVVKIFLDVSKEEQALRFLSRMDTPKKNWKVSKGDIDERAFWNENMKAFQICINKTATEQAPWYVVPADHKWYARLIVSRIVLDVLTDMDPHWPKPDKAEQAGFDALKKELLKEGKVRKLYEKERIKTVSVQKRVRNDGEKERVKAVNVKERAKDEAEKAQAADSGAQA